MKKIRILLFLSIISMLSAQWKDLSLEDVFKKSPFKTASIGQWKWLPDTDEYLFFKMDTTIKAKSLYKYDLAVGDTTLFLSGDKFAYDDENLMIVDYTINPKSEKILLVTDQQRIWRHSRSAIYYLYDITNG